MQSYNWGYREILQKSSIIFSLLFIVIYGFWSFGAFGEYQNVLTGEVIGITDGDSIKVLTNERSISVRLASIDCPEKKQAFGMQAKKYTASLCLGKQVQVVVLGKDRYLRTLGAVLLPDGRNLNHELVKAGLAWWYKKYAPDDLVLKELEEKARCKRIGIWSESSPIEPWLFRKRQRFIAR